VEEVQASVKLPESVWVGNGLKGQVKDAYNEAKGASSGDLRRPQ
jgi:hypothetical protein